MAVDPTYGWIETVATWPCLVKIIHAVAANSPWGGGVPHLEGRIPDFAVITNTASDPANSCASITGLTSTYVNMQFEDGTGKTCDVLLIWFGFADGGLTNVA